ncbi:hypothetical protein Tco_0425240 [Tanacetum coccineum]
MIKTPRQLIKDQETPKVNRKNWNAMMERELGEGYSFTKKKCFVYGSLSHLIKDCDYYEKKMAREAEVKKQRVFNTGNGVAKPVWTNANRINHTNQFVPRQVQLKTDLDSQFPPGHQTVLVLKDYSSKSFTSLRQEFFNEASYDEEGVITDFNGLPTEIEVSPTPTLRFHNIHPKSQILGDPKSVVQTRSKGEPKKISEALQDDSWVQAMQKELL